MAKFCKYCGSEIPEGGSCSCQASQAAQQPVESTAQSAAAAAPAAAPAQPNELLMELKDVLLTGLKAPRQAAAKLTTCKNKYAVSGILAGVNAVAVILLLWQMMAGFVGLMTDTVSADIEDLEIAYPVLPMILSGILLAAIGIGLSGLIVFACAKLMKKEVNIVDTLIVAAGDSLYPTILVLVVTLMGLISMPVQIAFAVLLLILGIVNVILNVRAKADLDGTRNTKEYGLLIAAIAVTVLVVYLAVDILAVDWCLMGVEIEGTTIGEAVEELTKRFF